MSWGSANVASAPLGFCAPEEVVQLPHGFEAVKIWQIRKAAPYGASQEEIARSNLLTSYWEPKNDDKDGVPDKPEARCPDVWVDNVTIRCCKGMKEPEIIVGRWTKKQVCYGEKVEIDGLALANGGHHERRGKRKPAAFGKPGYEEGDFSLVHARDKEMKQETGIDRYQVKATKEFGWMDYCLQDPRRHGVRFITLRWIEEAPKPSDELKNVIGIPLSFLPKLIARKDFYFPKGWPAGKPGLGLILGHDLLLELLLAHKDFQAFLSSIVAHYQQQQHAPAGFGGSVY